MVNHASWLCSIWETMAAQSSAAWPPRCWPTSCTTGATWSVDGVDGKAHYVVLNARDELANYPTGAVVEVKGSADVRAADKNITALASGGLYRTDHHLAIAQGQAVPGRDPQEVVAAHIRRLEALRRAGLVERVAEGLWQVPDDLTERGRRYEAQRLGGVAVELKSHLPHRAAGQRDRCHLARPATDRRRRRAWATWALAAKPSRRCSSAPTSWPNRGWQSGTGSA